MGNETVPAICENCRFWKLAQGESGVGECKRFPPQVVRIENEAGFVWPLTDWKDFCGEFKLRVDA